MCNKATGKHRLKIKYESIKVGKYFTLLLSYSFTILLLLNLCSYGYTDEVSNSDLLKRIERLEEENRLLKARLDEMAAKTDEFIEIQEETGEIKRLKLYGFADITYKAEKAGNKADEDKNAFTLGMLAFHLSSHLSDTVDVFGEYAIETDSTNTAFIDVERLIVKYTLSDLLKLEIGRIHTGLGYWNQAFHHGSFLQTTISRPHIYGWEDEDPGGILPVHSVGIQASGYKEINGFNAEYLLGVFNGRDAERTKVQGGSDGNHQKALSAMLGLGFDSIPGLKVGASIYNDKIPQGATALRLAEIDEQIFGGYATYFKDNVELLCEYFDIRHDDEFSRNKYTTQGYYIQGGYQFNKLKPYYRFDHINFGAGDPYYSSIDRDTKHHTLGIRYDAATFNAIKLEYGHSEKERWSDIDSISINTSFAF